MGQNFRQFLIFVNCIQVNRTRTRVRLASEEWKTFFLSRFIRVFYLRATLRGVGVFLSLSIPTWATSFHEVPFPDSVQDAPIIVRGRIGGKHTDWGKDDRTDAPSPSHLEAPEEGAPRRKIFTYYELNVTEVFKGQPRFASSQTIQMREMGGEKDGIGLQISGTAQFWEGEDVVVFLGEVNREGTHDVWGMMMGKYSIRKNKKGEEVLSGPGLGENPRLFDENQRQNETRPRKKWTLSDLRQLIRDSSDVEKKAKITQESASPSKAQLTEKTVELQPQNPEQPQLQSANPLAEPLAAPQLHQSWMGDGDASKFIRLFLTGALILGLIYRKWFRK